MRFLIPLILACSLVGYSHAQQPIQELPSGTSAVQIMGQTYYQHGDTFYRFNPEGGYFFEVQPPKDLLKYEQQERAHFYRRSLKEYGTQIHGDMIVDDVETGCRNLAAERANQNPAIGGKIYMQEFNRCMNIRRQN